VVIDLQPSTAPILITMHDPPPLPQKNAIQATEFKKYTYEKNK
jgi:hypothetical protein